MLWYTSENIEMLECDVVHVLRSGAVVATLSAEELSVGRMIAASFEGLEGLEEVVGGPAQP
jgi:ribose transport system ATP-binding protein